MRVAIVCVNYGSNSLSIKYLKSLKKAFSRVGGRVELQVLLVDNTSPNAEQEKFLKVVSTFQFADAISTEDNLGYFGAVQFGLRKLGVGQGREIDWLIVSNVDVEVAPDFFEILLSKDTSVGVIAPAIISRRTGRDRNPKMNSPLNIRKARFQKIIFSTYWIQNFYLQFALLKSFLFRPLQSSCVAKNIYAPHGSFIIFSRLFLEKGGHFNFPCFLFGEELFIGQQARELALSVAYEPDLRVDDFDHASTGQWRHRRICKYAGESAKYSYQSIRDQQGS